MPRRWNQVPGCRSSANRSSITLPYRFQVIRLFGGKVEPAEGGVSFAQLRVAVPVGTAGDGETEFGREALQRRFGLGRVAGVPYFEAIQPVGGKLPQLVFGSAVAEVRRDGEAARRVHQLGDVAQRGERLLDERRAAAPEIAIEGFGDVCRVAAGDEGARDVRAPQGARSDARPYDFGVQGN